jgi:hypothetical protein
MATVYHLKCINLKICSNSISIYFVFLEGIISILYQGKKQDPIELALKNDKKIAMMITFPNLSINDDSNAVSSQY